MVAVYLSDVLLILSLHTEDVTIENSLETDAVGQLQKQLKTQTETIFSNEQVLITSGLK